MNQPSALLMLADDLVVIRAKELLRQLACGAWQPAAELRAAIDAREEIRMVSIVKDASDSPAPITQRSVHSS